MNSVQCLALTLYSHGIVQRHKERLVRHEGGYYGINSTRLNQTLLTTMFIFIDSTTNIQYV